MPQKPKRFLLFMFDSSVGYQPIGGWNDLKGDFEALDQVRAFLEAHYDDPKSWRFDNVEIVDLETGMQLDLSPPKPKPKPSTLGFFDDDFEDEGRPKKRRRRGRRGRKVRR